MGGMVRVEVSNVIIEEIIKRGLRVFEGVVNLPADTYITNVEMSPRGDLIYMYLYSSEFKSVLPFREASILVNLFVDRICGTLEYYDERTRTPLPDNILQKIDEINAILEMERLLAIKEREGLLTTDSEKTEEKEKYSGEFSDILS